MSSDLIIETVKIVWNRNSGVTHAVNKGFAVSMCGIWYMSHGFQKKPYTSHLHVPGTEPTCKSCRKIMGLPDWSWTAPKVKEVQEETMQIYEFGDHNAMEEPVWIRTNRKIKLTTVAKADGKYLKKISAKEAKFIDKNSGIDLIIK
jgi:hypothetical protein